MSYAKMLGASALLIALVPPQMAKAADLVDPPVEPPLVDVVPSTFDWSGLYMGANVGYAKFNVGGEFESEGIEDGYLDVTLLGVQAGFNLQNGNWVYGAEADIAYAIGGNTVYNDDDEQAQIDMNWLATVRGRLGYAQDRTLYYGTAGMAFADIDVSFEGQDDGGMSHGWVVGAGIEQAMSNNATVKLEYNYIHFDGVDYNNAEGSDVTYQGHAVKLGMNWKF